MYTNVNRVLIGDGTNAGAITHLSGIKKGDLFIVRENGQIVAAVTGGAAGTNITDIPKYEKIKIACGIADGEAILSSPIQGNTVSSYRGATYAAPTEAVVVLGYLDTAGQGIIATEEESYRLRIVIKDDNRVQGQQQTSFDFNAKVPVGGDDASLAYSIAKQFSFKEFGVNGHSDLVKLERVSNGNLTDFAAPVTVTKGSTNVLVAGHALPVGTAVRLAGGTYVITAVETNSFTIDMPFVNATATVAVVAQAAAGYGSLATVTDWGFKLTGLPQTSRTGIDEYEFVEFIAAFGNVNGTEQALVTETKAFGGTGYWKQVRDIEEKAKGYLGDTDKVNYYAERIASNVVEGTNYASIIVEHANIIGGNFQDDMVNPVQTEIYAPTTSDQVTNSGTNFLALLNAYFGTKLGFATIATL
jgi:hypothetical protein